MKKDLLLSIVFVFFICMNIKTDIRAERTTNTGKSDNSTFETATEIQTGQRMKGTISTSINIHYYRYTVNEKGIYRIGLMCAVPLHMAVYDSKKNKLEEIEYDWEEEDSFMYTKKYDWEKDTVIFLKLFIEEDFGDEEDEAEIYEIKPEIVQLMDVEQETNNSLSKASTVRNGIDIQGTISKNKDIDYYCYTAGKTGTATLKFYCPKSTETYGWNIEVYDSAKKKLRSVPETVSNIKRTFSVKKGKKYYIKVYGGETCFHSNEGILNEKYRINIKL